MNNMRAKIVWMNMTLYERAEYEKDVNHIYRLRLDILEAEETLRNCRAKLAKKEKLLRKNYRKLELAKERDAKEFKL